MAPRGYFEKPGKVSLWLKLEKPDLTKRDLDILKTYCGVKYYNLDDQELSGVSNSFPKTTVADLLGRLSYSSSFLAAALKDAEGKELTHAYWALAQYNFAYDPKKAVGKIARDPLFLGVFDWNDSEDDQLMTS